MIEICITVVICIIAICLTASYNTYIKNKYNPELFENDNSIKKLMIIIDSIEDFKDTYFDENSIYNGTSNDLNIWLNTMTKTIQL